MKQKKITLFILALLTLMLVLPAGRMMTKAAFLDSKSETAATWETPVQDVTTPVQAAYEDYDYDDNYGRAGHSPIWIVIAIGIGLLVAAIAGGAERSSMKSVRQQTQARNYIKQNSLNLTQNTDLYLYKRTERTPLQQAQAAPGQMPQNGAMQQGAAMGTARQMQQPRGGAPMGGPSGQPGGRVNSSVRPGVTPGGAQQVQPMNHVQDRPTAQSTTSVRPTQPTAAQRTAVQQQAAQRQAQQVAAQRTVQQQAQQKQVQQPAAAKQTVQKTTTVVQRPTQQAVQKTVQKPAPAAKPTINRPTSSKSKNTK